MKNSRPEGPVPYVFILAASHSGSTLLTLLLNSHPEIATVGEITSGATRRMERYRCSCRELMTECAFWKRVAERVRLTHPSFDLADFGIRLEPARPWWLRRVARAEHRGPAFEALRDALLGLSPTWRRQFQRSAQGCLSLAEAVLELTGAHSIVDSSKLAHRLKWLRRMPGLDLRIVHLVRDGRSVALTYMDEDSFADARDPTLRRGGWGDTTEGAPSSQRLSMERAAGEWRRDQRAAEHVLAGVDRGSWIRVHYESLCADPDAVLRKLFTFLGLDPGTALRNFRAAEHHIVGNGMRLDSTSEIRLDERWKSVLSEADLRAFDAVAGDVNRAYGYA